LRKGAKRRSNPSIPTRRDGLLRFARNDDLTTAFSLVMAGLVPAIHVFGATGIACH
jgi:hypothetical protein